MLPVPINAATLAAGTANEPSNATGPLDPVFMHEANAAVQEVDAALVASNKVKFGLYDHDAEAGRVGRAPAVGCGLCRRNVDRDAARCVAGEDEADACQRAKARVEHIERQGVGAAAAGGADGESLGLGDSPGKSWFAAADQQRDAGQRGECDLVVVAAIHAPLLTLAPRAAARERCSVLPCVYAKYQVGEARQGITFRQGGVRVQDI